LHPSSALLVWLVTVLAIPFLGLNGLVLLALLAVLGNLQSLRIFWQRYLRRARFLLLTLWLIVAYNTPGEAWQDLALAPTYEGIAEANLQSLRLLVMLACLAALFAYLGRDGLVSALWGLLRPLQTLGADTARLVVRLTLVLDNLQSPPQPGAWRQMLAAAEGSSHGPEILHVRLPSWHLHDTLSVLFCLVLLLLMAKL
jgi:energy-coupling factor transporter transmembrane protein EcfT